MSNNPHFSIFTVTNHQIQYLNHLLLSNEYKLPSFVKNQIRNFNDIEINLMKLYQQQTQEEIKETESQICRARESEGFDIFKDQQFVKQKREESQMLKNTHKGIESFNVLTVTHIKQPQKVYSVFHREKQRNRQSKRTQLLHFSSAPQQQNIEFTLNDTLDKQRNPNPKGQRYTRVSQSEIKISDTTIAEADEEKKSNNKITVLKKIIEHYNQRLFRDSFQSNLINKVSVNSNSSLSCKNRLMVIKKIPPKSAAKKNLSVHLTTNEKTKIRLNAKSNSKPTDFFQAFFDQSTILVEAQGLNDLIKSKQQDRKKINKSVNERELNRDKYQKKVSVNPTSTKKPANKFQTLPAQKLKSFDNSNIQTSINVKVNKYKQFLFLVNYSNKIYRELDFAKYEFTFKIYIGKGNNNNLIKALMKRRFWFEVTKNVEEAHFIWTQLKEEQVYQKQKKLFEEKMQANPSKNMLKLKEDSCQKFKAFQEEITQTRHSMSAEVNLEEDTIQSKNITLDRNSPKKEQRDNKSRKIPDRNMSLYHSENKILTKEQLKNIKQIINELQHKKKLLFHDRLPFLKNFTTLQLQDLQNQKIHNHLPINGLLGNKKAMFYMLRQYYNLTNKNIFEIVPLTYHIKKGLVDEQYKLFMNKFIQNRLLGQSNYWIIKPGEFSNRGQGISCSSKLEEIKGRINKLIGKKNKSLIIQQYLTNPLLYNGRKFDIRAYMLLTINNRKLRGYWYQEGYIRTSSYQWTLDEIGDNEIHLTNDAIQKYSYSYGKYEPGNKLTYSQLQRYLDSLPRQPNENSYNFSKDIYPNIKAIATDAIKSTFCFIDPERKGNNFQVFGFDFMIDKDFKPWLIEINTNPCLEMSCPVLNRIIPSMVENAFRIGLDPLIPPPLNYSSTYKYSIPQNALHYNKFQLIFDEDRDGPVLVELYRGNQVVKMIDEYEQDKQTYQQEGEELILEEV